MKKLDATQSALLGCEESRKNFIRHPTPLTCDGCGKTVYVSKEMIASSWQSAFERGHRLFIVCRKCAEPFLQRIASKGGEVEVVGKSEDFDDVQREIENRRKLFLQSN